MMRTRHLETASVAVCVRSADGTVRYQNKACKGICGEAEGRRCNAACEGGHPRRDHDGAELLRAVMLHGRCCDVSLVRTEDEVLAFMLPLTARVEKLRRYFASKGLTAREIDIAALVAIGKSNAQIVGLTGLSRATVRTHLNHVHQKLPPDWLARKRKQR